MTKRESIYVNGALYRSSNEFFEVFVFGSFDISLGLHLSGSENFSFLSSPGLFDLSF